MHKDSTTVHGGNPNPSIDSGSVASALNQAKTRNSRSQLSRTLLPPSVVTLLSFRCGSNRVPLLDAQVD